MNKKKKGIGLVSRLMVMVLSLSMIFGNIIPEVTVYAAGSEFTAQVSDEGIVTWTPCPAGAQWNDYLFSEVGEYLIYIVQQ